MEDNYHSFVFINCPFDEEYEPLFHAIIFTVYRCGFFPKSALEEDDSSDNRIDKIFRIIGYCKYGIHDISRTELDKNKLPRFNMPYELGLFWGAKKFGNDSQRKKVALILEREKFSSKKYLSDINGVDPKAHNNDFKILIKHIRNWLAVSSRRKNIPSPATIIKDFEDFYKDKFPKMLSKNNFELSDLTYNDYCLYVEETLDIKSKH